MDEISHPIYWKILKARQSGKKFNSFDRVINRAVNLTILNPLDHRLIGNESGDFEVRPAYIERVRKGCLVTR